MNDVGPSDLHFEMPALTPNLRVSDDANEPRRREILY
jgi:hypothetical protein